MTTKSQGPTTKGQPDLTAAACMIINGIDTTADADPDTMLLARRTDTHIVIITHLHFDTALYRDVNINTRTKRDNATALTLTNTLANHSITTKLFKKSPRS